MTGWAEAVFHDGCRQGDVHRVEIDKARLNAKGLVSMYGRLDALAVN
jgi:hypothetical protein